MLAALTFAVMVPDRVHARADGEARPFRSAVRDLPVPLRRYLIGVGLFDAGDYAHTLMIIGLIFSTAGAVNGVQDTLEGSATGGLVPKRDRRRAAEGVPCPRLRVRGSE